MHECKHGRLRCFEDKQGLFLEITSHEEDSEGYICEYRETYQMNMCIFCGFIPEKSTPITQHQPKGD